MVYAVKRDEDRHKAAGRLSAAATPATEPLSLQEARAPERGRGREADDARRTSPGAAGRTSSIRTYQEIQNDRLLSLAAGVVFYSLVALFPAIAAGVSSYALFANAATIASHLSLLADIVPGDSLDLLRDEITRIAAQRDGKLTFGFVFGFGIALWSANAGMKAIFDALNIIYDEEEKRGFVWLNLVSLFFTFCAIGGMLLAIGAVVVFPLILAAFGLSQLDAAADRDPALAGAVRAADRRRSPCSTATGRAGAGAKWRWITVGSVFAAVAWLSCRRCSPGISANFANYNATYGSLGAVVGLMMWMWLSTIVVLVGAELNSEIEHQTARDTTVGCAKPLGARGAVMADTVGEAKAA